MLKTSVLFPGLGSGSSPAKCAAFLIAEPGLRGATSHGRMPPSLVLLILRRSDYRVSNHCLIHGLDTNPSALFLPSCPGFICRNGSVRETNFSQWSCDCHSSPTRLLHSIVSPTSYLWLHSISIWLRDASSACNSIGSLSEHRTLLTREIREPTPSLSSNSEEERRGGYQLLYELSQENLLHV